MEIPVDLATQIVKDMKKIIKQDLNFISTKGVIIASTDIERIGTIHKASMQCIKTGKNLVINTDYEYEGSKKGINIPVYLNNEIVGVIGITGEKEEIEKYGNIIKTMTEILIKEAWIREIDIKKREFNRNIIEYHLSSKNQSKDFYINLDDKYVVIVGNLKIEHNNDEIYKLLERYLSINKKNVFTIISNEIIIFLNESSKSYILSLFKEIQSNLKKIFLDEFSFGIGSEISNNKNSYKNSYLEARDALNYSALNSNSSIVFYNDLDIGILLPNLSDERIREFLRKVFKNVSKEKLDFFQNIFNVYKENNGSIKETSEKLFMHKNTLQYQLNKIEDLTGYNPRKLNDFTILNIAFSLRSFNC